MGLNGKGDKVGDVGGGGERFKTINNTHKISY